MKILIVREAEEAKAKTAGAELSRYWYGKGPKAISAFEAIQLEIIQMRLEQKKGNEEIVNQLKEIRSTPPRNKSKGGGEEGRRSVERRQRKG